MLNAIVLEFMNIPNRKQLLARYVKRIAGRNDEGQ